MSVKQRDVWWADLAEPRGSAPGFRRPVVVVQGDAFNDSRLGTVLAVPLTSNTKWAGVPGNVVLSTKETGLTRESVALVAQMVAVDRAAFDARTGAVPKRKLAAIFAGLDVALGR